MTSAGSSLSLNAFATPDAGFEYLATAEHYRHLAGRIVDALRRGCLVLVTGKPPANPTMLAEALRKAMAPRMVIEVACVPELDPTSLFADGSSSREARPRSGAERTDGAALALPVFVFADADRLSDAQIKDLFEAVLDGVGAGVLLAHPTFLARFENSVLHPLEAALTAHFSVQHLERDEVEAFIRHQLPPADGATLFTARRMALIALTSGGDPAVVNRLARRMLEIEPEGSRSGLSGMLSQAWRRPIRKPAGAQSNADEIAWRNGSPHYGMSLKLPAAIIIGLGILWLITGGIGSRDLSTLVSLLRSHMSSRQETPDVLARAAPPLPSEVAAGASSDTPAPAANTAPDREAEPVPSAEPPSAAPSSGSAPPEPRLSAAETAALVARGDRFLEAGDVASARLFFERAADAGDGRAAMRMAVTYDAALLERAGLRGLRSDPERASFWYRRARDLGEGKEDQQVRGPEMGLSGPPPR
jgi:hypothetical protein